MEQELKRPQKIVSQQNFAKSNDLPIFVKLMIQKDRRNFLENKILEAKRLMGISDDRVLVRKISQSRYVLEHEYADSRSTPTSNNRISKTQHATLPQVELKVRKVLRY
jgi:hypothetical protein